METKKNPWWRGGAIYQIYPRSYQDDSGDGVGDLPGITRRLPHIQRLGVDAIWISPIFTSPMVDFGYDTADYRDIDPLFGTLADFETLLNKAHELGLKVIIDLVLSHSSDKHAWFEESRASKDNPRADWYVWADAKPDGSPPNNWLSVFGGSAWRWDTRRCQYYLHNFCVEQPDLNFHNPDVRAAMLDVARFWLDRGVDGFRLDVVNFYTHDAQLRDNPPAPRGVARADGLPLNNPYSFQQHIYDKTRPENLAFIEALRALTDAYEGRMLVGEVGDDRAIEVVKEYTRGDKRLHMAYSFELLGSTPDAALLHKTLAAGNDDSSWPCWALSNHDVVRSATRWGDSPQLLKLAAAFLLSQRGSVCIYQGEELGLTEVEVPFERLVDPYGITMWPAFKGRDGCRTPMVWEAAEENGGFSGASETWLPVGAEHLARAVDQQGPDGPMSFYQQLLALRAAHPALHHGALELHPLEGELLQFSRALDERIRCIFNLSASKKTLPRPEGLGERIGPGAGALNDTNIELEPYGFMFIKER